MRRGLGRASACHGMQGGMKIRPAKCRSHKRFAAWHMMSKGFQNDISQLEKKIRQGLLVSFRSFCNLKYSLQKFFFRMLKVCARWVPCQLTDEHQAQRTGAVLEFLMRYHNEGDQYPDRIVTGDEILVHFWTLETKEISKFWKTVDEPAPKKFKEVPSASKVMATVFWGRKGVILIDHLPNVINVEIACKYTVTEIDIMTPWSSCGMQLRPKNRVCWQKAHFPSK